MIAEIITIGDELLIGQVVDTNSAWMGQRLNEIGIKVMQITSVSDDKDHIVKALKEAEQRADVILITGGLGPTKDDITKITLAEYFGSEMIMNDEALENVKSIFKKYNRPVLEVNVKQALVPAKCKVLINKQGTAPAMYFNENQKHYFSMPGVPFEMKYIMQEYVIPTLAEMNGGIIIKHESINTAGIGESFLAEQIEKIEEQLPPNIKLAYLPKLGTVRLRLTGYFKNESEHAELLKYKAAIINEIKENVVAEEDISLEESVLRKLIAANKTLSTAESCTGGYIGHLMTSIAGSSAAYEGGVISYSYDLKKYTLGVKEETLSTFGAVSKETVEEMVLGALEHFKTDYAIACSGIAGPGGGTEDKPVGTVWIAVASNNKVYSRKFQFGNQRLQNIERTAIQALWMLFRLLREELN
jgi:nicotinamide-nucleotide amidase